MSSNYHHLFGPTDEEFQEGMCAVYRFLALRTEINDYCDKVDEAFEVMAEEAA